MRLPLPLPLLALALALVSGLAIGAAAQSCNAVCLTNPLAYEPAMAGTYTLGLSSSTDVDRIYFGRTGAAVGRQIWRDAGWGVR